MIGILHKKNNTWVVLVEYLETQYSSYLEYVTVELPVISEQQSLYMFAELTDDWMNNCEGKEVEFEHIPVARRVQRSRVRPQA